jgi:hypothetical protein
MTLQATMFAGSDVTVRRLADLHGTDLDVRLIR